MSPTRRLRASPTPGIDRLPALAERTRAAGVAVELHYEGEPRGLVANIESAAYRIVQESLTNAVRHASATKVTVRLDHDGPGLRLEIEDDGAGAPDGFVLGNGILGMRERAAALGGELQAAPGDGGGFRVRARLPGSEIGET